MKIVCLGWGSLIWDSRELEILPKNWNNDGPSLPIEFCRVSGDNRVTLVIDDKAPLVNVLWADMSQKDSKEATCLLAKREGTKHSNISKIEKGNTISEGNAINVGILNWLKKHDRDVAIWTGLSKNRNSIEEIITHLNVLDECDKNRAEEYIRKAPSQIDTPYRKIIEKEFGWTPDNNY
ncbi:TPA: hypothetical protein DEP94_01735 [Candidatus Nomurabacteria bacterium]|nr:hypothetical protein [Candidatus Nomurabacteria bacterium]